HGGATPERREMSTAVASAVAEPRTLESGPDELNDSLPRVALAALQELQGGKSRLGTEPVFPSVRTGDALKDRAGGSTALEEAKIQEYIRVQSAGIVQRTPSPIVPGCILPPWYA